MTALTTMQSAAHKAWATRRARAAQAAILAKAPPTEPSIHCSSDADLIVNFKPYQEPKLSAVEDFRYVELYRHDDRFLGSGLRSYIPLDMGSTQVRLFNPATLTTISVPRQEFDDNHLPVKQRRYNRDRLRQIITKRLALVDNTNAQAGREIMKDGGVDTARAITLLSH